MQRVGVMVLCIILPGNRILLHRIAPTGDTPEVWGITQEVYLPVGYNINSPTRAAVSLLRNYYKVEPDNLNNGSLLREGVVNVGGTKVFPFVYHTEGMFSFTSPVEDDHRAIDWENLYDDITAQAIHNELGSTQEVYTTVSVHATAEIHRTGHFDLWQD